MRKKFNITGLCLPEKHYMADISEHLRAIKTYVDEGSYLSINCARQYGKTTTLYALTRYLAEEYLIISLDFQSLGHASFQDEHTFSLTFAEYFLRELEFAGCEKNLGLHRQIDLLRSKVRAADDSFVLFHLFIHITAICQAAPKPILLIIDEADSASNNQVFLDFLSQLRHCYLEREKRGFPAFHSVILAGVYDIQRLQMKLRPQTEHKTNSPWNIAAEFDVDLSLTRHQIAQMLQAYEEDCHTGMDVPAAAQLIYDYTSGYPFLVSWICKRMDEEIACSCCPENKGAAWTREGILLAVRRLTAERNTLFESLNAKLDNDPELEQILSAVLFMGKEISYNTDNEAIALASMLGFVINQDGNIAIANRIFETRLYNRFLSAEALQEDAIYKASLWDRNQFVLHGRLNMRLILERFVSHFHEIYGDSNEAFLEECGRKLFLLYLRPIINGKGNYYIESRTRSMGRTDIIVDYCGEQFIIETKIWRGKEYHSRGEQQIIGYLDDYQAEKGYLLSFCFNKKKEVGVQEFIIDGKVVIEATV
ncbi:MAG: 9-O-acetyl-N-acetylneuraminate esterase [Lachnospiraceae bacterium]|nr:9-O-acetyl-N-acetylneuraminate esterase [Lachnospiraceae bacterium]